MGGKKGDYPPGTTWFQAGDDSPPVFTCANHQGRSVVLSTKQWDDHILLNHPEMARYQQYVEWCVVRPDVVTKDRRHPFRECYYLHHVTPGKMTLVIRTVVDFDESVAQRFSVEGFVVTSHLMRHVN